MNPPRTLLAAAFALFAGTALAAPAPDPSTTAAPDLPSSSHAADAGTTGATMKSVPDNFVGPLAPGECYASQCPGAMGPTESSLVAMGTKDAQPSVQQMEDDMLKGGTYSSIARTPDGAGAVITMPDGSIMWSDYKQGFDTIPKKPADILKDPNATPAMVSAAKTALMKQQGDKGDGDPKGDTAKKDTGGFTVKSLATDGTNGGKVGGETSLTEAAGGENGDAPDGTQIGAIIGNGGRYTASSGGLTGSGGLGGAGGNDVATNRDKMNSETADAVNTALTPDKSHFTFNAVNRAANTKSLNDLRRTATTPSDQGTGPDDTTRGGNTNFFGR